MPVMRAAAMILPAWTIWGETGSVSCPAFSVRPSGPRPTNSCLDRSEEHTSELQSLMRISYAVFCLKKKKTHILHSPPFHLAQLSIPITTNVNLSYLVYLHNHIP